MSVNEALLLIGHGSARYPDAADQLRRHAEVLRSRGLSVEIAVLNGSPSIGEAWGRIGSAVVRVVPFFMEDGYFTKIAVPKAVRAATSAAAIRFAPAIGTHDGMAEIIERQALAGCAELGVAPEMAAVVVIGHGSASAPGRALALHQHSARVGAMAGFARVQAACLEEAPFVADVLAGLRGHPTVVIGFFANQASHVLDDVPDLLAKERGVRGQAGSPVRFHATVIEDPAIADLILEQASAGDDALAPSPKRRYSAITQSTGETAVATNKRKVMLPHTMGQQGIDIIRAREDIETVIYPAGISQADLLPQLANCSGIALSGTPFKHTEMESAPAMQVVARIGVGFDAVEVPALTARRVPLMVAGTANSVSVAEQAFHLMITLAKKVRHMDSLVRDGKWHERHQSPPMELSGKTVLIIGFGRIGTRSAKRCIGFDMNVLIFDPYVDAAKITAAGCEPVADLDAALPRADFVSIHCPKSPATINLINADRLAKMKKGAFLVNTARGGIINEPALYDALVSGQIAGAGLDVFDMEPTPLDNKLLSLSNVIASPHMAGVTVEAIQAMAAATARNILSVLDGAPNRDNTINPEVYG